MTKRKTIKSQGTVVAVATKDLPRRLGLLLRRKDGQERWFSFWKHRDVPFPTLERGDQISFSYVVKPAKNGNGEPFLNITELEVIGRESPVAMEQSRDLTPREVEIRSGVSLKAAAATGLAQSPDDVLAIAERFYHWIAAKVEEARDPGDDQ